MAKDKQNVTKNKSIKTDIKLEKKKIDTVNGNFDTNIWNGLIIVCVVIIVLSLFYILTIHITDSSDASTSSSTKPSDEATISYSEIMVGRSFTISDGEYLVAYFDENNEDINSSYTELISNYKLNNEHLDIYTVDMSNGLNKAYASDSSNTNPTRASEIAFSGPTLIKFKNNQVVDYIEGLDDIASYLQ